MVDKAQDSWRITFIESMLLIFPEKAFYDQYFLRKQRKLILQLIGSLQLHLSLPTFKQKSVFLSKKCEHSDVINPLITFTPEWRLIKQFYACTLSTFGGVTAHTQTEQHFILAYR